MKLEIEITLDELLDIADKPLRKYLHDWYKEDPETFGAIVNIRNVKIIAKDAINCEIILESGEEP